MSMQKVLMFICVAALSACDSADQGESPADLAARAMEIAQESIIFDGHIDVPYRLEEGWVDVSEATDGGDFL